MVKTYDGASYFVCFFPFVCIKVAFPVVRLIERHFHGPGVGESTVVGGIIFGDVNLVIVIHSLVVAVQRIGDNLGYIAFAHHEHFIHFAQAPDCVWLFLRHAGENAAYNCQHCDK